MTDAANSRMSSLPDVLGRTAIIILTWNEREETRRCLQSIESAGYALNYVVLWDNGSVDDTDAMVLEEFPAVVYHHHPSNKGVASGRNAAALLAFRALSPTHLLFLDNDMVVTEGFLEALAEPFADEPMQGQSVAKIRFLNSPDRIHSAGGQVVNFALATKQGIGYCEIDEGQYEQRRACLPNGGATLVAASLFKELEGFDAIFDPFGTEDLDFAYRVRDLGYKATFVPQSVVYHDYTRKSARNNGGKSWIAARVRQWLILMHRHATLGQKMAFCLGGGLVGLAKVAIRHLLSGDVDSLNGIPVGVRGFVDELPRKEHVPQRAPGIGIEID